MKNHKIIFTGPVGAGKTTAIASISDRPPVCTNEVATDMTKDIKKGTTVALDYGVMNLEGGDKIHLYGTPGQERFDFMWDILSEGGIGLILLINNARPEPFKDMHFFLNAFRAFIDRTAVAIGITQTDISNSPTIGDYYQELKHSHPHAPVFEVDARERNDMTLVLEALLLSLDPGVEG